MLELAHALRAADQNSLPGVSVAGACDCDEQPIFDADVMRRGDEFLTRLEEQSGAKELIGLVRELAQASEHGLGGVMRWLNAVDEDTGG